VYVASENRVKDNEFVLGRPDISTIVAYQKAERLEDTRVLLIREFRSACSNSGGFVWEIPGGSTFADNLTPERLAAEEFHEETGLRLAADRFVYHQNRQLYATFSAHKAHVFSVELTVDEMNALAQDSMTVHGLVEEGERTYNEVWTLKHIRQYELVDWSMLGMIMQVLLHQE
jgi:8-oxo-dGTP pyrophosphatase MutT (NUDIX family)